MGSDFNSATYLLGDLGWVPCPLWAPEPSLSMEGAHIHCVSRCFFPGPSLLTLLSLCRRAIVSGGKEGAALPSPSPAPVHSGLLHF